MLPAPREGVRDEPRRLHLLDEAAEIGLGLRPSCRQGDGLLDHHEPARQEAHVRVGPRIGFERLADRGHDVHAVAPEDLQRLGRCRREDALGVLEVAAQVEVVGGVPADGDLHPRAVDLLVRGDRRIRRDHVGPLDGHVGRRVGDGLRPLRVDGQEGHVPGVRAAGRVHDLSGRVVGREGDRHLQPPRHFPGEVGRDAGRLTVRPLLGQDDVAVVDRGPQRPRRGDGADQFRGDVLSQGFTLACGEPEEQAERTALRAGCCRASSTAAPSSWCGACPARGRSGDGWNGA